MGGAFLVIGRIGPPRIRLTESGGAGEMPCLALSGGIWPWPRALMGGRNGAQAPAARPEGPNASSAAQNARNESGSALFFDAARTKSPVLRSAERPEGGPAREFAVKYEFGRKNRLTNGRFSCIISFVVAMVRNAAGLQGSIAQLGERLPYKQDVIGSSPIVPSLFSGGVAQLARACGSYPQCRRFKSVLRYFVFGTDCSVLFLCIVLDVVK